VYITSRGYILRVGGPRHSARRLGASRPVLVALAVAGALAVTLASLLFGYGPSGYQLNGTVPSPTSGPALGPTFGPTFGPSAGPSPSPTPGPLLRAGTVTVSTPGFWSWSLLDLTTGLQTGSQPEHATSDTASMSKAWIVADYLRRSAERHQQPSSYTLTELSRMIRDSETKQAFKYHVANGNLASINRMIRLCGLTDSRGVQNSWSLTRVSARDAARLASCIGDGRAAGPKWTAWLLDEMRNVRGDGRFGIIDALPPDAAKTTAIKNGWLLRDDRLYHMACMAIGDRWTLAVLARYPGTLGKDHGIRICREVTRQLLVT
jgi:hypothetical protein